MSSISSFGPAFFAEYGRTLTTVSDSRWLRAFNGFVKVKASHDGENIRSNASERSLLLASVVVDSHHQVREDKTFHWSRKARLSFSTLGKAIP